VDRCAFNADGPRTDGDVEGADRHVVSGQVAAQPRAARRCGLGRGQGQDSAKSSGEAGPTRTSSAAGDQALARSSRPIRDGVLLWRDRLRPGWPVGESEAKGARPLAEAWSAGPVGGRGSKRGGQLGNWINAGCSERAGHAPADRLPKATGGRPYGRPAGAVSATVGRTDALLPAAAERAESRGGLSPSVMLWRHR